MSANINALWERHADFRVGKSGANILLAAQSDAAKALSKKLLPKDIPIDASGNFVIDDDHLQKIACGIVDYGMTMEDM